jgi:hypothetical protein
MSTDPIRQAVAAKRGTVRYTLPDAFAPDVEPAPVDVESLTPGTGPVRPQETGTQAFDRFLRDSRAGAYGA